MPGFHFGYLFLTHSFLKGRESDHLLKANRLMNNLWRKGRVQTVACSHVSGHKVKRLVVVALFSGGGERFWAVKSFLADARRSCDSAVLALFVGLANLESYT